jgi:hypothetical protein
MRNAGHILFTPAKGYAGLSLVTHQPWVPNCEPYTGPVTVWKIEHNGLKTSFVPSEVTALTNVTGNKLPFREASGKIVVCEIESRDYERLTKPSDVPRTEAVHPPRVRSTTQCRQPNLSRDSTP